MDSDELTTEALHEIAKNREKEIETAGKKLAKTINFEKLIKGHGDDEHKRELHKTLALAGIST